MAQEFSTKQKHYIRQGLYKLVSETEKQKTALLQTHNAFAEESNNINTLLEYYDKRTKDLLQIIDQIEITDLVGS